MAYHIVSSISYMINKVSSEVRVKVILGYKIKTSHILNRKNHIFRLKMFISTSICSFKLHSIYFIAISLFIFDCSVPQAMIKGCFKTDILPFPANRKLSIGLPTKACGLQYTLYSLHNGVSESHVSLKCSDIFRCY